MNTFIVRDFDLKIFSYAWGGARDKGIAATAHNKLSSLLYPMISNRPGSNEGIMEMFAEQIGTDFVTLQFSYMLGTRYRF